MTLVARCPGCQSVYRLTVAQLQALDGEVCCGQCTRQFNGFHSLVVVPEALVSPDARSSEMNSDPPGPAVASQDAFELFERKQTGKVSRSWPLANLLLSLLLLGQLMHGFRTEIAISLPATRPLLENYCALIRCQIDFPRHLALLSLESSDLRVNPSYRPEVVILQAVIRNHAPFPQAFPALLLTLTDKDEQPLASRVLTAKDYLDPGTGDMGFAAESEIVIQHFLDTGTLNAMGYRLELFYP
ncbi:DUF3426 domain-containing protein [Nitrosomonas sp. ANs5]|uniref:DUF3426 domain-containing protein n=1 Tax=Nitrosomonas sp. ANs5 TaxID=3423941 RepID=UPI003D33876F